jgi:hypothetical protein
MPDHDRTEEHLVDLIRSNPWMVGVLEAVRDEPVPHGWVGAGVLRDLVWGELYGPGFSHRDVRDVDVAFFDAHDLSRSNDDRMTSLLRRRRPEVPWEATNQAAVHTWYSGTFGTAAVQPLTSIPDAVGTWPETATAVAARLRADDVIEVCAPLGTDDLLNGIWRHNPRRAGIEQSRARLQRHQPHIRWPRVTVVPPV